MTLYTLTNIFHVDGTQVVSSKGNRVTKFLIGRKRLIRGLELGLKKVNLKPVEKYSHLIAGALIFFSGLAIQFLGL